MNLSTFYASKAIRAGWLLMTLAVVGFLAADAAAQANGASAAKSQVTKIDEKQFPELLKPKGKPLLINFWATWCGPCREEFPDLVKIDADYKGKIDFITVTLDFEEELTTGVPKFLAEMKAPMPTYLLVTPDETTAIALVSKDWSGALPLTILYGPDGKTVFSHQGVVKPAELRAHLDKLLAPTPSANDLFVVADFVKIKNGRRDEVLYFYENNWKAYREEAKKRGVIDSFELVEASSEKNAGFDLILITRFRGKEQLDKSEENFAPILKQISPNGPALKNGLAPADIRENVFAYTGRSLFTSFK